MTNETPHRATSDHWAYLRQWGADSGNTVTALLELRARVEALEADGPAVPHGREPASVATQPTPASSLVEPSGIFPTEYADSDGDGIRILMEPADETGRVCWAVRNSRHINPCHEFPTPEAAYAAHKAASAPQTVVAPAPASSLVERVVDAIAGCCWTDSAAAYGPADEPARAVIREVATWLRDRGGYPWALVARVLEKEADR